MEKYLGIDKMIFLFIQEYLRNPLLDMVLPLLRNKFIWLPLYIVILIYSYQWGKKVFFKYLLFLIGLVSVSDMVSSRLLKPVFHRLRPCNDFQLNTLFDPLVSCGSGLSFPSSHAVNHFALAAFLYYTAHFIPFKWRFLWYVWAFSICFAQVYVGVHYPLDVFIGGLIGFYFGNIVAKTYLRILNKEKEVKG